MAGKNRRLTSTKLRARKMWKIALLSRLFHFYNINIVLTTHHQYVKNMLVVSLSFNFLKVWNDVDFQHVWGGNNVPKHGLRKTTRSRAKNCTFLRSTSQNLAIFIFSEASEFFHFFAEKVCSLFLDGPQIRAEFQLTRAYLLAILKTQFSKIGLTPEYVRVLAHLSSKWSVLTLLVGPKLGAWGRSLVGGSRCFILGIWRGSNFYGDAPLSPCFWELGPEGQKKKAPRRTFFKSSFLDSFCSAKWVLLGDFDPFFSKGLKWVFCSFWLKMSLFGLFLIAGRWVFWK